MILQSFLATHGRHLSMVIRPAKSSTTRKKTSANGPPTLTRCSAGPLAWVSIWCPRRLQRQLPASADRRIIPAEALSRAGMLEPRRVYWNLRTGGISAEALPLRSLNPRRDISSKAVRKPILVVSIVSGSFSPKFLWLGKRCGLRNCYFYSHLFFFFSSTRVSFSNPSFVFPKEQ